MLEMEMMEKGSAHIYRSLSVTAPAAIEDIATILGRQMSVYTIKYQAAAAARLNIPLGDVKALDLVMAFDALATGHLAQLLGISAGGATALINRLENAGLVVRDRNPLDRRVIVIRAVAEKCDVLLQERRLVNDEIAALARRYGSGDMETVHGFVMDLARVMRRDTLTWLDTQSALVMDD